MILSDCLVLFDESHLTVPLSGINTHVVVFLAVPVVVFAPQIVMVTSPISFFLALSFCVMISVSAIVDQVIIIVSRCS